MVGAAGDKVTNKRNIRNTNNFFKRNELKESQMKEDKLLNNHKMEKLFNT
jgi:hypothetical protein